MAWVLLAVLWSEVEDPRAMTEKEEAVLIGRKEEAMTDMGKPLAVV